MMGEELNAAEISKAGVLGDRAYALVDSSDGKVASAKNPRKWPQLFEFRAALADAPATGVKVPPVRITLPDGTIVNSDQPGLHQVLSKVLQREVTLDAVVYVPQEAGESTLPDPRTAAAEECLTRQAIKWRSARLRVRRTGRHLFVRQLRPYRSPVRYLVIYAENLPGRGVP